MEKEKYEVPQLEVINMQADVILCATGGCSDDSCHFDGICPDDL